MCLRNTPVGHLNSNPRLFPTSQATGFLPALGLAWWLITSVFRRHAVLEPRKEGSVKKSQIVEGTKWEKKGSQSLQSMEAVVFCESPMRVTIAPGSVLAVMGSQQGLSRTGNTFIVKNVSMHSVPKTRTLMVSLGGAMVTNYPPKRLHLWNLWWPRYTSNGEWWIFFSWTGSPAKATSHVRENNGKRSSSEHCVQSHFQSKSYSICTC